MLPEIFKDRRGNIIGVIVGMSSGEYEALALVSGQEDSKKSLILENSFDQLEKARYWIRMNALPGIEEETQSFMISEMRDLAQFRIYR